MSVLERGELAERLTRDVIELAIAGVRHRHPELDDHAVLHEVARRRFGEALADAAYGRPKQ